MFIAALPTIAKTWKQPQSPSTEEYRKHSVYTQWNITQPKKDWKKAICSNMNEPRDYHTKWNKRERQITCDITYMWNLKNDAN